MNLTLPHPRKGGVVGPLWTHANRASTLSPLPFLGNAPDQPFDEYRFRNWRWFWDFGGGIFTDLMVHWIDVAYWFCDLDDPRTAMSIGDHFRTAGLWETPDTVQTLLRFPRQKLQALTEARTCLPFNVNSICRSVMR